GVSALFGATEGGFSASMKPNATGVDIAEGAGMGALNALVDVDGAKVAMDHKARLADRILGGASTATSGLATGSSVASFTPLAPVALPTAIISGLSNVGIGLLQDGAHAIGIADNPGTIEKTKETVHYVRGIYKKSKEDPLGNYMDSLRE